MEVVGLNEKNIRKISEIKHEEQWILDYRLKSYELFKKQEMPNFGPKFDLDFDKVIYYKSKEQGMNTNWNKIDNSIKCEFQNGSISYSNRMLHTLIRH